MDRLHILDENINLARLYSSSLQSAWADVSVKLYNIWITLVGLQLLRLLLLKTHTKKLTKNTRPAWKIISL